MIRRSVDGVGVEEAYYHESVRGFLHYFVCGLYGRMLEGRKSRTWKVKTWCRLARRRDGGCGCKKQFLLSDKDECRWCGG